MAICGGTIVRALASVPADAYAALALYDNDMLVVPSLDLIVIRQVGNDSGSNRQVNISELFPFACSAVEDLSGTLHETIHIRICSRRPLRC